MRFLFTLIIISILLLWGCTSHSGRNSRTEIADQLISEEKYQEAYDLIASYKDTLTDEKERHLEMLQWVIVNDKLFQTLADDSLIKRLLNYYIDKDNEPTIHPIIFYYAGRTYKEMLKRQLALKYFYKTLESANITNDRDLLAKTHAQIGELFLHSKLYALAKDNYYQEYLIEIQNKDFEHANETKSYLAFAYRGLGQPDSASILYKEMIDAPYFKESKGNRELVISQYLSFLLENHNIIEAKEFLQQNPINRDSIEYPPLLSVINKIELREGNTESVKQRSLLLLSDFDIYRQRQAADNLSRIFLDEGKPAEALKYTRLLRTLSDSIVEMEAAAYLSEMAAIHDVSEKEQENDILRQENLLKTKHTYWLWGIIGTLLFVIAIIALGIVYWRSKVNLAHKKALLEAADTVQEKLSEINRYQKELTELKAANEKMAKDNLFLEKRKNEAEAESFEMKSNLEEYKILEESKEKSIAMSEAFCEVLKKISSGVVAEEDFLNLEKAVMDWDPEGMMRLKQLNLSSRFYKDALLIIGNIPPKVCATILNVSPQAVSTGRTRIFKTVAPDSSQKDWVSFIKSLFTHSIPN